VTPVHIARLSASGVALTTPSARLVGTLAVPFVHSANASSGLTSAPGAAPATSNAPGRPLPAQRTTSSAWHACDNKSTSIWQAVGQWLLFASRQE
jgi:hypothetical protein